MTVKDIQEELQEANKFVFASYPLKVEKVRGEKGVYRLIKDDLMCGFRIMAEGELAYLYKWIVKKEIQHDHPDLVIM